MPEKDKNVVKLYASDFKSLHVFTHLRGKTPKDLERGNSEELQDLHWLEVSM